MTQVPKVSTTEKFHCSNIPNLIVENTEFRFLVEALDPHYSTPSRTKMAKELHVDLLMDNMKARVSIYMDSSQKISVCADIWTNMERHWV